jgi:glycosyltransferase involved in cell wall biosynthesis
MARLTVSCIIPVYNQIETLRRAVDSAVNQCSEVIVIDDGSLEPVNLFIKDVYVYRSDTNNGVVTARNVGIEMAYSDLILPLDADDTLEPDAVEHLLQAYEPGSFVYGDYMQWEGDNSEIGRYVKAPPIGMITRKNVAKATFLFSREDALKVGGYHPDFEIGAEDWAFMLALLQAGVKPKYVNKPILNYTLSDTGRAANAFLRRKEIVKRLRKHYGVMQ